jgi:hypothetical protein
MSRGSGSSYTGYSLGCGCWIQIVVLAVFLIGYLLMWLIPELVLLVKGITS